MNKTIRFYLAQADRNGLPVSNDKLDYIRSKLALITGGFSEFPIKGYWMNANNNLIIEDTSLLESFTSDNKIEEIRQLASEYKFTCDQESVLLTIDGAAEFL